MRSAIFIQTESNSSK